MSGNPRPRRLYLLVGAMSLLALSLAATVSAAKKNEAKVTNFTAKLKAVPHDEAADGGSNVTGIAKLQAREDGTLKVRLTGRRTSAQLPHAVHIHGKDSPEVAHCPGTDRRDDLVDDGLIETAEGLDDYGGVLVSFTTRGDTSEESILALDRFPVSKRDGLLKYKRTFNVPLSIASRLDDMHIVVHGEDLDGNGRYGGRTTALGAPLEGELPVACGELVKRGS
jgi:hypothetical protein